MVADEPQAEMVIRKRADAWFTPGRFALLLAVLISATFFGVLAASETFFYRDFGPLCSPFAYYQRECFWRGELPLWNPLSNCGTPFLAQWNTMVLYPFSLLYLLLPLPWSLGVFDLAHLFLGGLGMYFLAYRWTGNRFGACVAGTAFAYNGLALHSLMWINHTAGLGWMPWVVLTAERAWREGGRRKLVAAGLVGATQMLTGAPEPVILTWFLLGVLWLAQLLPGNVPRGRMFWRFLGSSSLAGGLAAVQMLPFVDLVIHSQRGSAAFAESRWAMPGWGWANFIVPLFHCSPSILGVYSQNEQQLFSSYYLGIGVLALACLAVWRGGQPRVYVLAGIALAGVLLAMGENTPLYGWITRAVPLSRLMRYPVKFVFLTAFTLPPLAAFALRQFPGLTPSDARIFQRRSVAVGTVLLLALAVILGFARHFPRVDDSWAVTWQSGLSRAAFLVLILSGIGFLARADSTRTLGLGGVGILLLFAFDGITHTPNQNPAVAIRAYGPLGIEQQVSARLGESRVLPNPRLSAFLSHAAVPDPFDFFTGLRRALYLNCNLLDGIPSTGGFFSLQLRQSEAVDSLLNHPIDDIPAPLADFVGAAQISGPDLPLTWHNRTNSMPLVTAGQKPLFAGPAETIAALSSPAFDPRTTVYFPLAARDSITVSNRSSPQVISRKFAAQAVVVEVLANEPALLTVAQSFYYPWHAYVDGRPVRLWEANYGFQGLEIPSGRHEVRLLYEDKVFALGAAISLSALTICVVAWFAGRRLPVA